MSNKQYSKESISDFIAKDINDIKVINYNNKNCTDCNSCCDLFTLISEEEFHRLSKFLKKSKVGQSVYKQAIFRYNMICKEKDAISFICPFSKSDKRCAIYNKRPAICRDFHCKDAEKWNNPETIKSKTNYGNLTMFELFKDDLLVNPYIKKLTSSQKGKLFLESMRRTLFK